MKIICLIRQVPDAEAKIKTSNGQINLEGATTALDGMDEYGIEEALRIGGETIGLALGPDSFETAIRRALAMGLDRAIHIQTSTPLDVVTQASVLHQVIAEENPDLVFVGGQHADTDSQALGAAVAAALDWPQITWTTKLELDGTHVAATHDVDDGKEQVRVALPVVVSTQQGLNEPRYPTLPNIMKAKSKPLVKKTLADFGNPTSKIRIVNQEIQERARLGKLIDGKDPVAAAQELLALLHNEAKVI